MTTTTTRLLTVAAFARRPETPDGSREELVRGEVVSTPVSDFTHGCVTANVAFVLCQFARESGLGRVTISTGVVTGTNPDSVRGPDATFWSFDRLPEEECPEYYPDVPPDVAAEVLSPWDVPLEIAVKVREYLAAGVRLVWVIDPDARTVTAFATGNAGVTLTTADELTGGDVLPGFRVPVADLFE